MREKNLNRKWGIAGLSVLTALAGCTSAPVTGKRSLDLVDDKALVDACAEAFAELKHTNKISKDPKFNATMERVCERVTQAINFWDMPLADWEFVVFDAPNTINALAMPGGKIAVFSGVFNVAKTDDELAVIIGHEIAHVTAKHVHARASRDMIVNTGAVGLGVLTGGGLTSLGILSIYGYQTGMTGLSLDREKETEADHIGLIYMARAGYNPRAAIDLWERIDDATMGQKAPPEWRSSHPSHENRLARLYGWMDEAEAEYQKAKRKNP